MDNFRSLTVSPGYNLLAYPYPAKKALNATTLNLSATGSLDVTGNSDVVSTTNPDASYWLMDKPGDPLDKKWLTQDGAEAAVDLKPSTGFWLNRRTASSITWSEPRPFTDPFGTPGAGAPQISNIFPEPSLNAVTLTILPGTSEKVDIYFKDLSENDALDLSGNWSIAAADVPVNGNSFSWTDIGESSPTFPVMTRTSISNVFMSVYLVASVDDDQDSDGIPDQRESLVYDTNLLSSDSDSDLMPDAWEILEQFAMVST